MGLIVAIDIGKGTEDLLIWDQNSNFENAIQLVSPSQTHMMQNKIINRIDNNQEIYIQGEIMAGEPWHKELYKYATQFPARVHMSETAAMSLRYNLDRVRSKGINIYPDDEFEHLDYTSEIIYTSDINWKRVRSVIQHSGQDIEDIETILICCQDHGNPSNENQSSRDFRMSVIYSKLNTNGKLSDLLTPLGDISEKLPRHLSVANSARNEFYHLGDTDIYVMDSSPSVILGVLDETRKNQLVVNVGNGHTIMMGLSSQAVDFAYEFHTGGITPERVENDISRIFNGTLTHEQSLKEGGHGLYLRDQPSKIEDYLPITLIGPKRSKLDTLQSHLAHPIGNMMMAGPYGLIQAYLADN